MQAKRPVDEPVQSSQTDNSKELTNDNLPSNSAPAGPWARFESAFPLGLPTVVVFLLLWILFGQWAWAGRENWPDFLQGLPQIEVPLLPSFALAVLFLLVWVRAVKRAPLATLGLDFRRTGPDVLWTLRVLPVLVLGYALLGGLAVLCVYVFAETPTETLKQTLRASFFKDFGFERMVHVLIAAPILEEICYRGMLYTPLRRERGRAFAIILTTLIFAFSHGTSFPVTQLLGGLVFAWAYECRRTLVAPMLLHFAGNGTLVLGGLIDSRWNFLS